MLYIEVAVLRICIQGVLCFESWPWCWISEIRCLMVLLSSLIGCGQFLPNPFQLLIHHNQSFDIYSLRYWHQHTGNLKKKMQLIWTAVKTLSLMWKLVLSWGPMSNSYWDRYDETEDYIITETSLKCLNALTSEVSRHQVYSIDIVTWHHVNLMQTLVKQWIHMQQ